MNTTFRRATANDAQNISFLSQQFGYDTDEVSTREYIVKLESRTDTVVLLALYDKVIVGWIQVCDMLRLESGNFCEIVGLVVDERYRGIGIGKLLVEQARLWSLDRNCSKLKVRTNVIRDRTHSFYSAAGFVQVKEQKVFEMNL